MPPSDAIELGHVLDVLRRRALTILVTIVACALLAYGLGTQRPERYEATAILLTGQGEGIANVESIQAIAFATQSLARMSTDRVVIEKAIRDENLSGITAATLTARTRADVPTDTQQILLTVSDRSPARAARHANAIAEAFSQLVEDRAAPQSNLSTILWQRASRPTEPANVASTTLAVVGGVFGLLLGLVLAAVRERVARRWRSEADVEVSLGIPVLASIPRARRATRIRTGRTA